MTGDARMSIPPKRVTTGTTGLPSSLRDSVAETPIESLDAEEAPGLSAKWTEEIRRRCAEVDSGTVELRDADTVFAEAHASLERGPSDSTPTPDRRPVQRGS